MNSVLVLNKEEPREVMNSYVSLNEYKHNNLYQGKNIDYIYKRISFFYQKEIEEIIKEMKTDLSDYKCGPQKGKVVNTQ